MMRLPVSNVFSWAREVPGVPANRAAINRQSSNRFNIFSIPFNAEYSHISGHFATGRFERETGALLQLNKGPPSIHGLSGLAYCFSRTRLSVASSCSSSLRSLMKPTNFSPCCSNRKYFSFPNSPVALYLQRVSSTPSPLISSS